LVGKPEGKIPLGRPRPSWEDNIKTDLRETGLEGVDTEHCNKSLGSIKCGEFLGYSGVSYY
jgi:hypothetical protein